MTIGERLLELAEEYRESKANRAPLPEFDGNIGTPDGREPAEIAADYEQALRDLLTP